MSIFTTGIVQSGILPGYPALDPNVIAWAVSMSATPSINILIPLSNFVTTLKGAGIWQKLDRMWLHANGDLQQATRDFVILADATIVGSPGFIAYSGFSFSNSGGTYLDSNYNPTINATSYTIDNSSIGIHIQNTYVKPSGPPTPPVTTTYGDIGYVGGAGGAYINTLDGYYKLNQLGFTVIASSQIGFTILTEEVITPSTNHLNYLYRNGSLVGSETPVITTSISNGNFLIGRNNNGGFNRRDISFTFVGGYMTSTDASIFNSAFQTLKTAIGFN